MHPVRMWLLQNAIAADRGLNALRGGSADETLSSAAFRADRDGRYPGRIFRPVIDWTFWKLAGHVDHCRVANDRERERWNPAITHDTAGMPLASTIRKGA